MDFSSKETLNIISKYKEKIHICREGIADYLDRVIRENKGFPARSFYGESFSYWLLSMSGERYQESLTNLISAYMVKDKEASNFHWEFNKFAWINVFNVTNNCETKKFAFPLRFKGTSATNWVLLRCCTQLLADQNNYQALYEAKKTLSTRQSSSGFIYDDFGVRSFQYHCFSSILTAEISMQCNDQYLMDRFIKSARFIENIVLRSGDSLYVGRGQQQSFGYGAIIYALALASYLTRDSRFIKKMGLCIDLLINFQRQDGSFPLVLNNLENGFPEGAVLANPLYPGWYAYNNYFDYLPFLGVMLAKAEKTLLDLINKNGDSSGGLLSNVNEIEPCYQDSDFLVFRHPNYEAVVARPGGHWKGGGLWTNDLPIPYIVCKGKRITPSYGGEQYGRTLFSTLGIPLPLIQIGENLLSMRDGRIWSFWHFDKLVVITPKAMLVRSFFFKEDKVIIKDRIISPYKTFFYYLFDTVDVVIKGYMFAINHGARVISDEYLQVEDNQQYFWGGKLTALRSMNPGIQNKLIISLENVICA